ncbi:205 kDa microtubule-associated protein-like isoform X2 [Drosophila subobscura]|uniref:205 kDa microtubule-associated protein-like isoform X2 n=1 Tax=Drosophila subobscura TaxID=7241 RepID=UPI00155AC7E6|nr:205 kDa microtubule-associated protein-like isoform X2 [Drosophila subobscura]
MEHEDNAQFDYLNRFADNMQQIAGGAGNAADVAGELVPNIAAASVKSGEHEDDEEWKYRHEVQQSEKQQQQHLGSFGEEEDFGANVAGNGNGNGFGHHEAELLIGNGLGNGGGAAAGFSLAYEDEDVEVIKNDGDFSTNSNTTTSTGEVAGLERQDQQQLLLEPQQDLLQQQQQQELLHQQEDEDEASSVATTYGTSSLSENNPTPLDHEVVGGQQQEEQTHDLLEAFDNKENNDPVVDTEESHSQLNPNAVAFVPNFGSQPSSPLPREEGEPILGLNARQLIGGPLDDMVAESPRKGSARDNMDAIAVPDEIEFDIEADKRPHELEQDNDVFSEGNLEQQLLNGAGSGIILGGAPVLEDVLDHGPETSVDLDLPMDHISASNDDIMKQSIYGEHNASIEDILNSVQPLPTQSSEDFAEKELLNVEEKEHVSQSPSTEELQYQANDDQDQIQAQHQQQLFGSAPEDPMQASFYLEHTSSDAHQQQQQHQEEDVEQLPADSSDPFAQNVNDQSLLLDTSAPLFSPEEIAPESKLDLELEPQQADIVDITPSPLSSTEEKHLVEDTKETFEQETLLFEPVVDAGAPPQVEEYAAFNAASGYEAQSAQEEEEEDFAPSPGINPFAAPFTPAHLAEEVIVAQEQQPSIEQPEIQENFNELQLQEEQIEEEYKISPEPEAEAATPSARSPTLLLLLLLRLQLRLRLLHPFSMASRAMRTQSQLPWRWRLRSHRCCSTRNQLWRHQPFQSPSCPSLK